MLDVEGVAGRRVDGQELLGEASRLEPPYLAGCTTPIAVPTASRSPEKVVSRLLPLLQSGHSRTFSGPDRGRRNAQQWRAFLRRA